MITMSPCKDCSIRHENCHSTCQLYQEYAKRNAELRHAKIIANEANVYIYESAAKRRKRYRR